MECVAIIVKVLVRPSFDPDNIDLDPGDERVLKDAAVAQVLYFGTDKSPSFAWLYMLKLDDRPEVIIEFDTQSVPEISGSWHKSKGLE